MRKWINRILCQYFDYHNFQGDNWSLQCANCQKHVYATHKTEYSITFSGFKPKKKWFPSTESQSIGQKLSEQNLNATRHIVIEVMEKCSNQDKDGWFEITDFYGKKYKAKQL